MEKSDDMKERIEHILRAKNMTAAEFADKLGVQASGLSHILSGRNNPSLDFVMKLKNAFPEYNLDWLMLGAGPMTSYEQPVPIVRREVSQPLLFVGQEPETGGKEEKLALTEAKAESSAEKSLLEQESDGKTLEMIVFVYSDGTFEQMRPRKKSGV